MQPFGAKAHKIFIIDDSKTDLMIMDRVLKTSGYQVIQFDNAQSAIEQAPFEKPDIIITDIVMRGMNGIDAIAVLRKKCPTLPIIAVTGDIRFHKDVIEQGANAVLDKRANNAGLVELIEELMAR